MEFLWAFLYVLLDVFPFLPLLYYALGKEVSRRGVLLGLGTSTLIVLAQGLFFATYYPSRVTDLQWQLTLRELFALIHLIPVALFVRVPVRKILFTFCVLVPTSLLAISVSYLPSYYVADSILFTHPCAEEVLLRALIIALMIPILYAIFRHILRPAMQIASEQIWSLIWLIPLFLAALSLLFTHYYFHTDFYVLFVILRFFVTLGCLVCCSILLQSLRYMEGYITAKATNEESRRLLSIQEDQYRIVTENIAQTRALRHDLRHQLFMIRNLTKDGKYEELLSFVEESTQTPSLHTELTVCDNYTVNGIATHYLAIARENDIDVSLSIAPLGDPLPILDTDLCILIGNSMENAIEACKKLPPERRSIRFHMKKMAGNLIMTIDNSYDGSLMREGERFLSTKRQGRQEGIGIRSIRSIAEKYRGELRIETKDDTFMLSVMLRPEE